MTTQTADAVFFELEDLELLEDRREYCLDDFQHAYPAMNDSEIAKLYLLVQTHFEPDTKGVMIDDFMKQIEAIPALEVKRFLITYFVETTGNGFEGFDMFEVKTIDALMKDFLIGLEAVKGDELIPFTAFGVKIESTI
jgi:hypothetical protein